MKIVMVTINPLFTDKVIGGSTKHLRHIAEACAARGHEVKIVCTARADSDTTMHWHPLIEVQPRLRFKQPFPLPYDIPYFRMARNIDAILEALCGADRLYLHDGEFLYPALSRAWPTVVSLRDCVYPETMLGSFLFEADHLITLNAYCRDLVLSTAGQFLPGLAERVSVVHNGFDPEVFRPTGPTEELWEYLRWRPDSHSSGGANPETILLHPHRPEANKGLEQTIECVARLKHQYGHDRLRVLIPHWFDADGEASIQEYLARCQQLMLERQVRECFHFHGWLPQRLMPAYFSLGRVTLVLGSFAEAFGNSAYESLCTGTPAVVSRVSSNRSLMPDELLPKVHWNDHDAAAAVTDQILRQGFPRIAEARRWVHEQFHLNQQTAEVCAILETAQKLPPLRHQLRSSQEAKQFQLAPWCYCWGQDQVYHDYLADHRTEPELTARIGADGLLDRNGLAPVTLNQWLAQGYVVPRFSSSRSSH